MRYRRGRRLVQTRSRWRSALLDVRSRTKTHRSTCANVPFHFARLKTDADGNGVGPPDPLVLPRWLRSGVRVAQVIDSVQVAQLPVVRGDRDPTDSGVVMDEAFLPLRMEGDPEQRAYQT